MLPLDDSPSSSANVVSNSCAIQAARGLKVDRRKVRLEEPIRETGTFMVEVEVGGGATAAVKTIVAEAKE